MKPAKTTVVLLIGAALMTSGCVSMKNSQAYRQSWREPPQAKPDTAEITAGALWLALYAALETGGPMLVK